MLTKADLEQIRKIVRQEVTVEFKAARSELLAEIKFARMEITNRIDDLEGRVKSLEISLAETQSKIQTLIKKLNMMAKDITKIKNRLEMVSIKLDDDHTKLKQRVIDIEDHLGISKHS